LTAPQRYKNVKEKAEQLILCVGKLKVNLAIFATDVDPEEERLTELSKSALPLSLRNPL